MPPPGRDALAAGTGCPAGGPQPLKSQVLQRSPAKAGPGGHRWLLLAAGGQGAQRTAGGLGQDGDQERVWQPVPGQQVGSSWTRWSDPKGHRAEEAGGKKPGGRAGSPSWTVLVRELSVSCASSWGSLLCTRPPHASTARLSQPSVPAAQPAQSGDQWLPGQGSGA